MAALKLLAGFCALAVFVAGLVICVPVSGDEHMYIAAGALLRDHALYRELPFLQAPYLPYAYQAICGIVSPEYWFVVTRSFSAAGVVAAALIVYLIARQLSGSPRESCFITLLFVSHHLVLFITPYARNHVPAMALGVAAVWAAARAQREPRSAIWATLAGVFSALAIGTRLLYVFPAAGVCIGLLCAPHTRQPSSRVRIQVLPFLLGMLVGLIPAAAITGAAGLQPSWFCNVEYHALNAAWRAASDPSRSGTAIGKAAYCAEYSVRGSGVVLWIVLGLYLIRRGEPAPERTAVSSHSSRENFRALLTPVALGAMIAAVVPTPTQRDYLAMPVPYIALYLATLVSCPKRADRVPKWILPAGAVLSAVIGAGTSLRYLRVLPFRDQWTPTHVARVAAGISREPATSSTVGPVATLTPIYPLAAGRRIYPELATGQFLYRVATVAHRDQREDGQLVGPDDLFGLLSRQSPGGVLIGAEPQFEQRFIEFAERSGFKPCAPVDNLVFWKAP